jgi:hypothetical protein
MQGGGGKAPAVERGKANRVLRKNAEALIDRTPLKHMYNISRAATSQKILTANFTPLPGPDPDELLTTTEHNSGCETGKIGLRL